MNYFVPFEHNFEPISPPDEPEMWWENYNPTLDDKNKAQELFNDFKVELASMMRIDDTDWEKEDYDTLFEILV